MTRRLSLRRCLVLTAACCILASAIAGGLGLSYTARLSSHGGFFLVPLTESTAPARGRRPRHTLVVVFDGLGYHEALTMPSLRALAGRGQCRETDVGSLPMSRPVYATLSTGLEQDRTGARDNDDATPLAAQSLWEVARRAGLSVNAVSELTWWRELFPRGFSGYLTPPREEDYLRAVAPADLTLIHPIYIDETFHESGVLSAPGRAAVARADREVAGLLGRVDLSQDLLIVTADHGHVLRGGHGGRQERVAHVLTCLAGPGIQRLVDPPPLRTTVIAPALALLLGLPFPADMRAAVDPGEDGLDALWDLTDAAAFPPGYLAARRAEITRVREQNRAQLLRWLPESGGSWRTFYRWHRHRQILCALPFAALALLVLALHRAATPAAGWGWAWMALLGGAALALQWALRGSFDMSSIPYRASFLRFTCLLSLSCAAGALLLQLVVRRDARAVLLDLSAFLLLASSACLAHPAALGWRVGFPLPPPPLYFFPYFTAIFIPMVSGVGLLLCLGLFIGAKWAGRSPPAPSSRSPGSRPASPP